MDNDILKGLFSAVMNGFSGDKLKGLFGGALDGILGGNLIILIILVLAFLMLG